MSALAKRLALRRRRRRSLAERTRAGPANADPGFWLSDRIKDAIGGSSITKPYSQHPWVFTAVDAIAGNIAQVPFRLWTGDEEDPVPMMAGEWWDFFRKPSPWLSASRFIELTVTYICLPPGEAFWVLFDKAGLPLPLPSQVPAHAFVDSGKNFTLQVDEQGQPVGWLWQRGNQRIPIGLWQVAQFARVNPDNPWRGMSPLESAFPSVRTDHKAEVWNEALLDNGADPGVVLKMPGLGPDQVGETRKQWEDRHKGVGKQGRVAVLTGQNDDVIRTALTHTEMGFLDQRKWSRQVVASVYQVPMFYMGVLDEVRLETSRESARKFWAGTLSNYMAMIESVVDGQVLAPRGAGRELAALRSTAPFGRFDTSQVDALKREAKERRELAILDRSLGFPRNQVAARHELGYDMDDGLGDVPLVGMGLERLEDVEAEPADPADFGLPPFGGGGAAEPDEEEPEDEETQPEEAEDETEEQATVAPSTRRASLAREASWHEYIRDVHKPGEARFRGRMRSYFNQRRAEILRFLREIDEKTAGDARQRTVTATEMEMFLAEQQDRWDTLLVDQTTPVYKGIMQTSLDRLGKQIGGLTSASMESPAVQRVLLERQQIIVNVNETLAKQLRFSILEGIGQQEGITGLEQRIKDVLKVADHRAAAIARTETGSASTGARYAGYEEEGITKHSWLTAGDEFVRDTHQIDGETVAVGTTFSNGLRYPLESGAPAGEVINCRCDTLPED